MQATAELTLSEYLETGQDTEILTFESSSAASDAAWEMRERLPPGWTVEASYHRVYLRKAKR